MLDDPLQMPDTESNPQEFPNHLPPELKPGDFMGTMQWASDYDPDSLVYRQCFVALVDILGYKQLIQSVGSNSPELVFTKVLNAFSWAKCSNESIQVSLFSDSLILATADSEPVSFWQLAKIIQRFRMSLLESGYLIRGAIALGPHFDAKGIWISPCLVRAYQLESSTATVARVLIDKPALEHASAPVGKNANGVAGIPHKNLFVHVDQSQIICDYDDCSVLDIYSDSIELLYLKTGLHPDERNLNEERIGHCIKAGNGLLLKYRTGLEAALGRATDAKSKSKVAYLVRRWNSFCSNFTLVSKLEHDYRIKIV